MTWPPRQAINGSQAITILHMQEKISGFYVIQCGRKFFAEIRRLEKMTLAERLAERGMTADDMWK